MDNKKLITDINAKIQKANGKWIANETSMLQLTQQQRRQKLGYNPAGDELSLEDRQKISASNAFVKKSARATYPATIDWRNFNGASYVNPVEDQGQCGSCVSFGVLSTVESAAQIQYNLPGQLPPLSEEQLFFCGNTSSNACGDGWYVTAAMAYCQAPGVVPAMMDSYVPQNAACTYEPDWSSMTTQISGCSPLMDTATMKTWLSTRGPLTTVFTVYADFYAYAGGVYTSNDQTPEGGHCVSVIGYSDTEQAWLCKNSWGTGWGEAGYFWIGYGQCGIDAQMWGVNSVPVVFNPHWVGDAQVTNTGSSESPSGVEFNGQLYCFHQGNNENGELWYNVFNGTSWVGDTQVPNTGITANPSAVVFNNLLYCFHAGGGGLWYNVFDGTNWSGDTQVPNTGIDNGPSAVVFNNLLYCFHAGNGVLWYNVFDGTNWSGDTQVPNTGMASSPSAIVYNNLIYCFHMGGTQLWYNIFDGANWLGDTPVPNTGITDNPSAIVIAGLVYCFHQGANDNSQLWYNIFDGANWLGDQLVPNTGIVAGPCALIYNGQIWCLHTGNNNDLWYNILDLN
jgi:C1A family cysteine protease